MKLVVLRWLFVLGLGLAAVPGYAFSWNFFSSSVSANSSNTAGVASTPTAQEILQRAAGLNPHVLALALTAYQHLHAQGYDPQGILTIVDYSKPSTERRMWVINLKTLQVPFYTLVAQGKNTGLKWARSFSDMPRSLESSIGVYLTANTYVGKHGVSLRLQGLDRGFNNNAEAREIVVHAANYVSAQFVRLHGYLGRSWGCFALNPQVAQPVIADIKDGTVLFAYYPNTQWLHDSAYLQPVETVST